MLFMTATQSPKHNFDFLFLKIYLEKMIYVYFYESIFHDKSIHIIFTFANQQFKNY
jgi:hypothetical protein